MRRTVVNGVVVWDADVDAAIDFALFALDYSVGLLDEAWPFIADLPLVSFVSAAK